MIRFILKRSHQDNRSGAAWVEHETFVADVPELESAMKRGGHGPDEGHDVTTLVGVEFIEASTSTGAK